MMIIKGVRIIILFVFMFVITLFAKASKRDVKYVKSDIDGKKYLVRDIKDKQKAANFLAKLRKNLIKLSTDLDEKKYAEYYEYKQYIERISSKIYNIEFSESSEDSIYTSYSVNKGEQIVFCLRSKNKKEKIHDINLVMYVALHEIAHVASPEYGHTELFKRIFSFLTKVAIKIGVYKKINFKFDPTEYCGLMISESII
jgi:predicted metal-dependent hydrolase